MDDYNRYVTAVNKIFDYLEKMKIGWNNVDNKNYIDTIDDFRGVVTSKADEMKKPPTVQIEKTAAEEEEEQRLAEEEARAKALEARDFIQKAERLDDTKETPEDTKNAKDRELLNNFNAKMDIPQIGRLNI